MIFEVANLISKPVGTSDCITITRNHSSNKKSKNPDLTGTIDMVRTDRGIWISAIFKTLIPFECSRCLAGFNQQIDLRVEEEYIEANKTSFEETESKTAENDENFKINTKLQLDLSDAITQYSLTSTPMKPICNTACLGICDQCGKNKNITNCVCENSNIESKWDGLIEWQKQQISKNS